MLVEIERKNGKILGQLAELADKYPENAAIPSPAYSEFYYGCLTRKKKKEEILDELSKYDVLHTTKGSSIKFAELKYSLEKQGKKPPIFDLLIASIVIDAEQTLVTLDKYFIEIKELKTILLKAETNVNAKKFNREDSGF